MGVTGTCLHNHKKSFAPLQSSKRPQGNGEQSAMANVRASSCRTSSEVDGDVTVTTRVHFINSPQSTASTKSEKGDCSVRHRQGLLGVSAASQHQNNRPASESRSDLPPYPFQSSRSGETLSEPSVTGFTRRKIDMYVSAECEPTLSCRTADSATGNAHKVGFTTKESLVEDHNPPHPCPRVRDNSQPVPAVPPRRREGSAGDCTNSLYLGSLPGGLSQQQFVVDGNHDYINQDHLDAILEEPDMAFEQERARMSNGYQKHVHNGDNYCLDEGLADVIARKGKGIVTPFSCLTF